jgi:uncharacterized small protein (DUF1192 family)
MGTYEPKQLINQYATGKLTPEMAVGHCLQHIEKLTETQTAASVSHYRLRGKVDELENVISVLQKEVARLTELLEKLLPKRKQKPSSPS